MSSCELPTSSETATPAKAAAVAATASDYYAPYNEYSKTLRTWFVAFGIGAPVVLLSNAEAWKQIVASGFAVHLGFLFLFGGGMQVILAYLNKHAMWYLYYCDPIVCPPQHLKEFERIREGPKYRIWQWYTAQNWIDEILDLTSLVAFGRATYLACMIFSRPQGRVYVCYEAESELAWALFSMAVVAALIVCGTISTVGTIFTEPEDETGSAG